MLFGYKKNKNKADKKLTRQFDRSSDSIKKEGKGDKFQNV
jgi:hypothetical protein